MNKRTFKTIIVGALCINLVAILSLTTEVNSMKHGTTLIGSTPVDPKEDSMISVQEAEIAYYQAVVDSIEADVQDNFEYVYPKFQAFNPNIDSTTAKTFAGIMNAYDLDATEQYREMYTGQILLESGAKQYRPNGDLVLSSAGAVGFCQIMPATCLGYMSKNADTTDIKVMMMLGAKDFTFAFDEKLNNSQKINKTKEWLSDVTNNIIMWGFITRYNLDKRGDLHTQLVSYNMGSGGANEFIDNGGDVTEHTYIKGIQTKLSVAESN